jgi:hypothetical protein
MPRKDLSKQSKINRLTNPVPHKPKNGSRFYAALKRG